MEGTRWSCVYNYKLPHKLKTKQHGHSASPCVVGRHTDHEEKQRALPHTNSDKDNDMGEVMGGERLTEGEKQMRNVTSGGG